MAKKPLLIVGRAISAAGAVLMATLVLALCRPSLARELDDETLRTVVMGVVVDDVTPAAQRFLAQAKRLTAATTAACDAGSSSTEELRQVFRDLAAAWGNLSVARFGPLTDDSRLDRIAFWPDPRGVIRRQTSQLAASLPPDRDAAVDWIAGQSAAVQGLPAFDLLAFGDDDTRNCPMATAVAGNIERLAAEVDHAYADPERLALMSPSADSPLYRSYRDSVAELIRALSTQSDVLRVTMINDVLRQATLAANPGTVAAEARPTRLFLRHAPATKSFLVGAVDGLQGLLAAMKLDPLLADDPRALPERARRDLQAARELLEALPTDLPAALADPTIWSKLAGAARALERFNRVVNAGIAPALGLKAGFNALDGD